MFLSIYRRFFRPNFAHFLILSLAGCANGGGSLENYISSVTNSLVASRAYSGPNSFPPTEFAGYGLFAFAADPRSDPSRFLIFCEAFVSELVSVEDNIAIGVARKQQMATFMPLSSQLSAHMAEASNLPESCEIAVKNYGVAQAQQAIRDANFAAERTDGHGKLTGRGPFLLAWSPGALKGQKDAIVLVADLSNVSSKEQAKDDLRRWRNDIQQNSDLWRRGWNKIGLRTTIRRWIDGNSSTVLTVLGVNDDT